MRQLIFSSGFALAAATMAASPAAAQASADSDVGGYLCAFAGKCGNAAVAADAEEEVAVKAAPATKGFRLAGATAASATIPAPATKGFRLAGAPSAQAPTATAPATKGFRLGGAPAASTAAPQVKGFRIGRPTATAAATPRAAPRAAYAAPRAAPVAAGAVAPGARADLMLSFGYNSDQMTPGAETKARGFAKALMMPELAGKRFMIEGHTDARGNRDFNVDLSRRRAQSVADFLVAQGVDRSRVEVRGVGPDEPLPGRSANAEANRRVEAVLIG